ncbi:Methylated-DNA--protein-cysteine methyltransferase, constitutive [Pseudidiomarina piscicola]|uniref:Methylated-DNA--protein-cysteine methyltransferase n=1 Tax=Pseudidiomarina piscicola TaxID=2614830 RepID=A0A6S6WPQ9_9GAMM|nr:methylated-DNA--[protein]-cysteine S-methyltransferase [Pseudidiomarina piscicola]CAB0151726.1 Methylated-DNA--protein-cysteine methyltransferase, constitutive [Pseudidiomarina piscicola]VZT41183.1 Methylated-DNA--protein-cysteine methyltransferase, constitutive [Pseudomonas aeruginosa]
MNTIYQASIETQLGTVTIDSDGEAITRVAFGQPNLNTARECNVLNEAVQQLSDYFAGHREHFKLPLRPQGTEFQRKVWRSLEAIPYGKLVSYGDIANTIGNPKGVRAVGMANSKNPIGIIIPCHRVIGVNRTLTGYAGGLDKKEKLLRLEGCWPPQFAMNFGNSDT